MRQNIFIKEKMLNNWISQFFGHLMEFGRNATKMDTTNTIQNIRQHF